MKVELLEDKARICALNQMDDYETAVVLEGPYRGAVVFKTGIDAATGFFNDRPVVWTEIGSIGTPVRILPRGTVIRLEV